MRWTSGNEYKKEITIRKFLWYPCDLRGDTRWLEYVDIIQFWSGVGTGWINSRYKEDGVKMDINKLVNSILTGWNIEELSHVRKISHNDVIRILRSTNDDSYSDIDVANLCVTILGMQEKHSRLRKIKEFFRPTTCWNCRDKSTCLSYNASKADNISISKCNDKPK